MVSILGENLHHLIITNHWESGGRPLGQVRVVAIFDVTIIATVVTIPMTIIASPFSWQGYTAADQSNFA